MSKINKLGAVLALAVVASWGGTVANARAESFDQCAGSQNKQEFETLHRLRKGGASLLLSDATGPRAIAARLA